MDRQTRNLNHTIHHDLNFSFRATLYNNLLSESQRKNVKLVKTDYNSSM